MFQKEWGFASRRLPSLFHSCFGHFFISSFKLIFNYLLGKETYFDAKLQKNIEN